jgi:transposase
MAISLDLRERAVSAVREDGEKQMQVAKRFKISISSLKRWLNRETLAADKPGPRTAIRLNREKLKELVEQDPDAYLDEYAEKLGSKRSTVAYNLNVLGISRKKKHVVPGATRS